MIRNIKGKIQVLRRWWDYDAHMVYIMFLANRFELDAMFKETFHRD